MTFNTPQVKNNLRRRDFASPTIRAILLSVILVLFSWFILKPQLSKTSQTRAELKVAQEKLKQTQVDDADLNQLISKLHNAKNDVALVDEALPLSARITKANLLMQSLIQASGMSVAQLNSEDIQNVIDAGDKTALAEPFTKTRKLHTIIISASVTGTMEQFQSLLKSIETDSRVLDVESMDITGTEQQTSFKLVVKAYAYEGQQEGSANE